MRKMRNRLLAMTLAAFLGVSAVPFGAGAVEPESDAGAAVVMAEAGSGEAVDAVEDKTADVAGDDADLQESRVTEAVAASEEVTGLETEELARETDSAEETVKIDASNFPDENFREAISEYFDSDNDGWVDAEYTSSEKFELTWFYVNERDISSLEGIELLNIRFDFFFCYGNNLTSLDLT